MEKHKVICPYCGAGCQFNLLVQNGQVVGTEPLNGITNQSELCLKLSLIHISEPTRP